MNCALMRGGLQLVNSGKLKLDGGDDGLGLEDWTVMLDRLGRGGGLDGAPVGTETGNSE